MPPHECAEGATAHHLRLDGTIPQGEPAPPFDIWKVSSFAAYELLIE